MSYQVLARKWRPRNFSELVGQTHVAKPLSHALDNGRLHQALLFTGTRGVGKTTIARIIAKSLNCEQGVSSQPCGQCGACLEVEQGRFIDLIEIDAASRTKVEDTRDLLDNVQYAPTRGRYKVYLIDEVHMLSNHSFNALLKTLEEPPPHVVFLLATTDPQRLPVTVLSRCLQFHLKRLSVELMAQQLSYVLQQEQITADPAALSQIAQAGDGSMRDALSLLDQAIAFGGGQVDAASVSAMLGTIDQRQIERLLEGLVNHDASALLDCVTDLAESGADYVTVLADLLTCLQRIAVLQVVPKVSFPEVGLNAQTLHSLAMRIAPEEVQLIYQIGLIGRRDLPLSPDPRGGLEMVLLRMLSFAPASYTQNVSSNSLPLELPQPPAVVASLTPRAAPRSAPVLIPAQPADISAPAQVAGPAATAAVPQPIPQRAAATPALTELDPLTQWGELVDGLPLAGMGKQLARQCAVQNFNDSRLTLRLESVHAQMRTAQTEQRLQAALDIYFGKPIKLHFVVGAVHEATPAQQDAERQQQRLQAAAALIEQDANVRAMQETFNATVKPDSIRATD